MPSQTPSGEPPMLSLIIPVYNEAAQVGPALTQLIECPCPIDREWIVVDDASDDGSAEILADLARKYPIRLFTNERNLGKGASVIRGLREANGDFVMIHDADFEYEPRDIPDLLAPLLEGSADVVYGSRFKKTVQQVHRTYHYFVNRLLTVLSNLFSGVYLTDMETCYKIFRADLVRAMRLRSQRFGIEVELTAYLAKTHARVFELPIHYYPRTRLEGKKIGWRDGIAALGHLVRFNWLTSLEDAFEDLPERYTSGAPSPSREPKHARDGD
jgi:glycosyltransferase involved in cell wall biosynthesis